MGDKFCHEEKNELRSSSLAYIDLKGSNLMLDIV